MVERKSFIAVKYKDPNYLGYLTVEQVASMSGIHPEIVERFVRLGLIDPVTRDPTTKDWLFEAEVIPIVKKIIRLRNDLGINYAGIGVVLDLLDKLEELERRITSLEIQISRLIASQ